MFQSKLFLKLFFTYMLVISFYCFLCVGFLFYENSRISELQTKRECEIRLDEVSNILEQRIVTARNIVQNLSYSTTMKQLYMSERTGGAARFLCALLHTERAEQYHGAGRKGHLPDDSLCGRK